MSPPPPFSVRRAAPADAAAILECLRTAFEPYRGQYTPAAFGDTVLTPGTVGERFATMAVFLAATAADQTQIEACLCEAISTAKQQKSTSLAKPAEATYAKYRRQKASAAGGSGFRLPLC